MRFLDFSSWQAVFATLFGIALFTLISMGIRLVMMFTVQQRRERMNRQINERLKTLIAAYKTLGGSFTGTLAVNPVHLRELRRQDETPADETVLAEGMAVPPAASASDRARRIRDAVEAALADIFLLGTEEQVRLAENIARDMVAGRSVHTGALVVSLRTFIRKALDLEPIPAELEIPVQGPVRPSGSSSRGKAEGGGRGGGGGAGGMGMGGGGGGGMGMGGAGGDPSDTRS